MSEYLHDGYPYYTEAELDALYERDPVLAMRLSQRQAALARAPLYTASEGAEPTPSAIAASLDEVRGVLRRDGGDLEFAGFEDGVVSVRMTGACAGCPRSALDFKNVVERMLRGRFAGIKAVRRIGSAK